MPNKTRFFMSFVLSLLLIQGLLGAIPAGAASPDDSSKVVAPTLAAAAPAPKALPPSERRPVFPKNSATLGLASVSFATPPATQTATTEALTSDLQLAPASSGSNFDTYADPATGQRHLAVVYGTDVNEKAGGSWRAADGPLVSSAAGHSARRSGEARIVFPKAISESDPVRFEVADGTLTLVPEGVTRTLGEVSDSAITYPNALPATDIVEALAPGGFKERLVLASTAAPTTFTWNVVTQGLTLDSSAGDIAILAQGKPVARIPVAVIVDAKGRTVTQPLTLSGDTISLSIDSAFLAKATYPIVVDPGASTLSASRDTYTDSSTPSTSYETTYNVFTKASGPIKHAWVRFDTSSLTNSSRLVYSADLKLKHVSGSSTSTVHARQVTSAWPATLTYTDAPSVAGTIAASEAGNNGGTWTWSLGALYQSYIEGSSPDYGVRLEATSGQSQFNSKEQGTPANRPSLVISYNDLPAAPGPLTNPGAVVETDSPILHVPAIPTDSNGDAVLVKYQVALCPAGNCASADFGNPVYGSQYTDQTSARVPSGYLVSGSTYAWRVRALDVCTAPSTLCSTTDAAGVDHAIPTSAVSSFQVTTRSLGRDPRYQLWTHEAGNGISMATNIANGNLNLDVPFDMFSTRLGDVRYGMTYNSLGTANTGLGTGWQLYATPDGVDVPVSLVDSTNTTGAIKLTTSTGRVLSFVESNTNSSVYHGQGNGLTAGTVIKNTNNSYTYQPSDGGKITFDASKNLKSVRAPSTTPSQGSSGGVLSYTYNASNFLTSVTDPDGRTITFTWSGGALDKVTAQDGRIFEVTQSATAISFVDPTSATIAITRDSATARPTSIKDGFISAHSGTGWSITYNADSTVATVTAPPGGAGSSPTPWTFTRTGPYFGQNASVGTVTDPRGSGTSTFTQQTDFNNMGLPIKIAGPADQTGYWPIAIKLWDTNGNLVCERSPAANAYFTKTPTNCNVDEAGADYPELSTKYVYQTSSPFAPATNGPLLPAVAQAAAAPGGSQPAVDMTYLAQTGLSYSNFGNVDLSEIPKAEGTLTSMTQSYGTGAPTGVTAGDNWAQLLEGTIDVAPGTYKFRFYSNDGIKVVIDSSVLVSCFATTQSASNYNCGTNSNKTLQVATAGHLPITVSYSELTGAASFNLQWDGGTGGAFTTIPASVLHPATNLQNDKTSAEIDDGTPTTVRPVRTQTYANDDQKITGLPSIQTVAPSAGGGLSTTTETNRDNYGRVTSSVTAKSTPAAATTSYTYNQTQCFITQDGPAAGAHIDQTCNFRGQPTSTTTVIRAVASQPAQTRTTSYTYDNMGRLLTEDPPGGAITTNTYDPSGRLLTATVQLASGSNRVTTNTYDDAGRMLSANTTSGGTVNYTYDWADNQLSSSDPRSSGWLTTHTYDALNRQISSTSPSGLVTATLYTLSSGGTFVGTVAKTEPDGVTTTTTTDVRGQEVSDKAGSLPAATYAFDDDGNMTRATDPSGAETLSSYDVLGNEWRTKTTLPGAGNYATTTSTFDAASNLKTLDGPRGGSDIVNYTYDGAGNLLTVQQTGLSTPNITTYTYDDANELVKVDQPLVTGTSFVRTFTYGTNGNQLTSTDARGTITSTYDDAGRLLTESLPNGVNKTYTYDAQGRNLSIVASKPGYTSATRSFLYDLAGNLTKATQGSKVIDLTYDSDRREVSVTTDAGDVSTNAFNAATGKLTSLTTVAGTTNFTWGTNGLLSGVQDPLTGQTTNYTWDSAGRLAGRTDPAGLTWVRTYDAADRVDTQTISNSGGQIASFDLGYDEAGNVTSRAETVKTPAGTNLAGSGTWSYGYDPANRMTSALDPSGVTTTYGYDAAGNRISVKVGAAAAVTTTYDTASLPTSSSDGTTYAYDAMGTLTATDKPGGATGDRCYSYDQFGLLSGMQKDATTGCGSQSGDVTYLYDALGRTTSRTAVSGTTSNAYEMTSEDLVRQVTGGATTTYVNSPEGPLASSLAGQVRFFTKDLHGDVIGTTNASGAVASAKLYSPWGEAAATSGETTVLGFQSQATDADSGFVDMTTRLYGPDQGRFTSRDSLLGAPDSPMSMNQYGFGGASPIAHSDPTGMNFVRGDLKLICISSCSSYQNSYAATHASPPSDDNNPQWTFKQGKVIRLELNGRDTTVKVSDTCEGNACAMFDVTPNTFQALGVSTSAGVARGVRAYCGRAGTQNINNCLKGEDKPNKT